MIHDPLYRKIIERLDDRLDPTTFQHCANDLLMKVFPTLAPMQGGDDQGMDGAIADVAGDPTPLIATTDEKVLRNLRMSLTSRIKSGTANRKAVLATSRRLSNKKKRDCHEEAEKQGFHLINIYDQLWFAGKLYRDSVWRQQLLGLSGDPPALSAIPFSVSASAGQKLVGREADRSALLALSGDRMLVGQPGSGKSFLLGKLALEGEALFIVSDNPCAIANAIREHERIPLLVVDDAHKGKQQELLRTMLQLRNDLCASFHICAVSWPGREVKHIQDMLGVAEQQVLELGPLTIDEIVEVLSEFGLPGPRWLVADIVQQAEGRPGLAVTLATACLFGDWSDVVSGRRLEETVLNHVARVLTEEVRAVLASLALGGDTGLPMSVVAHSLKMTEPHVRQLLSELESSGIIREAGENTSVRPHQLRCGLIRDTFFVGAKSIDPSPLIANMPDICETTKALVGAAARGADVPPETLRRMVHVCNDDSVYEAYAWLGPHEAKWVLATVPDRLLTVADAGLHRAPRTYIPLLLHSAVGDDRELRSTLSHPLRKIVDWINQATPSTREAVSRRRVLLDEITAFASAGGDERVCLHILPATLAPRFEYTSADVSSELRGVLHFGYLTAEEISELCGLWPDVLQLIRGISCPGWNSVLDLLGSWAHPLCMRGELHEEVRDRLQEQARVMLADLLPMAERRPAIAQKLSSMARCLQVEIDIPIDRDFAILFPEKSLEDRRDWEEADRREAENVRQLAQELLKMGPERAMEKLSSAEEQASLVERKWPRLTPYAAQVIAGALHNPLTWLQSAVAHELRADIVEPFLHRAIDLSSTGWADVASDLIDNPTYRGAVLSAALQREDIPNLLLEKVLANLEGFEQMVDLAIIRGHMSPILIGRLLRHERPEVSIAAAQGEWGCDPRGHVRDELRSEWEDAVIAHGRHQYWIADALRSNQQLALRWLERILHEEQTPIWRITEQLHVAADVLTNDQKLGLLNGLSSSYRSFDVANVLVGEDVELYEALLRNPNLQLLHLTPLSHKPGPAWEIKVVVALRHSYPPEEIARATLSRSGMAGYGKESVMWQEWIDAFAVYCGDPDSGLSAVAEAGKSLATAELRRALRKERYQQVHGI